MYTKAFSLLWLAGFALASGYSNEAGVVQYDNLGYSGRYFAVSEVTADSDGNCTCSLDMDDPVSISGTNSPFNRELSVHIRGPMNLRRFAFYTPANYTEGSDSVSSWTRGAYYDAEQGTADNVTFLGNVGDDNDCLGHALNYVTSNGTGLASESTVLDNVTIGSDEEYAIYSGTECPSSSRNGACGVYRDGINAYQGFSGTVKAFFFEFYSPTDDSEENQENQTTNYDMPAIWLLNAQIPRTSQYPTNGNCSSWNSGGGEFDIFEVMNTTERNNFYTTIHDYQGSSSVEWGIEMYAYLERTPESVMRGGVVFGPDGTATVFMSNSTSFDSSLSNSDISGWVSSASSADGGEHAQTLPSVTLATASTQNAQATSSSRNAAPGALSVPKGSNGYGAWCVIYALFLAMSVF